MSRLAVSDLLPATNYAVQVRVIGHDGITSDWSPRVLFTTLDDTILPSTPTSLTFVPVGNGFHAEWDPVLQNTNGEVVAIDRYEVELTGGVTTVKRSANQITSAGKIVYDLSFEENIAAFTTPQPTVTIRVRAIDTRGLTGAWTSIVSASNAAPATPVGATIPVSVGADTISLRWLAVADTDLRGYRVYVGTTSGFTPSSGNLVYQGNSTQYTYTSSTYSLQYFKIRSYDEFNQESGDLLLSGTPTNPFVVDTTPPGVPTIFSVIQINSSEGLRGAAQVDWTLASPPTDLAGFALRFRRNASSDGWIESHYSDDVSQALVELFFPYVNYDFQIRSYDFYGNYSAWSTVYTGTATPNSAPANVGGLSATPGRDSITYNWTAVADTDIKNYEVTFSLNSGFTGSPPTTVTYLTGTATTLTVGGLAPSTTYYARVRAVDTAGLTSASWSGTNTSATTAFPLTPLSDGSPPASSPTPTVTAGLGYLNVSWTPVANADLVTYEVHVSTSSGFTPSGATKAAENAGTTVALERDGAGTLLAYSTNYYVKLIAKDRDGSAAAGTQTGPTQIAKIGSADSTLTASDVGADPAGAATAVGATKNTTFVQGTTPTSLAAGDVWINTSDNNKIYTASASGVNTIVTSGSGWYIRTDLTTKNAIFVQSGTPTATKTGDLWVDTGNGNVLKSWNGTSWVLSNDAAISTAQTTANGKNTIFVQSGTPSATKIGDIWIDTGNGNLLKTASSTGTGGWVTSQDAAIATAQTTANGKNKVVYSTSAASGTGYSTGDIWFQTASGNVIAQWFYSGGWQATMLTDTVLASLTVGKLQTGTLGAININVGASGVIQSNDYSAGTAGWKLGTGGLEINNGIVRANALSITVGGGNLQSDSSFETGIGTWLASAGSVAQSATQAYRGTKSLRITWPTAAAGTSVYDASPNTIPIGTPVTVSMYVYVPTGVAPVKLNLNGALTQKLSTPSTVNDAWQRLTVSGVTTSTGGVYCQIQSNGATTAGQFTYIDAVQIEQGDVATAYAPKPDEILPGTITGNMLNANIAFISNLTINSGGSLQSALYTSSGGASGFQLTDTGLTIKTGVVNANTLVSGTGIVNNLIVNTGGGVQSGNFDATHGFQLSATGLIIRQGTVSADTFASGTIGGAAINIAAGTSLILNGGYLKSNTYTGTAQASNPSGAGFYLGNDGIRIDQGMVSASAFTGGTFTGGNFVVGAGGSITSTGFTLSNTGLVLLNGDVRAAALSIQDSDNLMPSKYADFEFSPTAYNGIDYNVFAFCDVRVLANARYNSQVKRNGWTTSPGNFSEMWMGTNATDYNIEVEPSTTYIVSVYAMRESGTAPLTMQVKGNGAGTITQVSGGSSLTANVPSTTAWTRYYGLWTSGASDTKALLYFKSDATVAGALLIDGVQFEKQIGNLVTPSQWKPPGQTSISGYGIRTGSIQSNQTAYVWDSNPQSVVVSVTTTNASKSISSVAGFDIANDAGKAISGAGIPVGATIASVTSTSAATLSVNATAGATVSATIVRFPNGNYKIDPANSLAWSIDTQGNASFGRAQVRGSLIVGDSYTTGNSAMTASQQSFMASSNYVPGSSGWMLRADGTAEFRAVAVGSFNGNAIAKNTLSADAIIGGTVSGTIVIGQEIITAQQQTPFKVTFTSGSPTLTAASGYLFYTDDVGINVSGTNIPATAKITAVASNGLSATISSNTTGAAVTAQDIILYRGRRVRISGSGITLSRADGLNIISLPTDPSQSAQFTGSIVTSDLFVQNNFRMYGSANSIAQGGTLGLAAGTYIPLTAPQITFDWVNQKLKNLTGADYTPNADPYVNYPVGLAYNSTTGNLHYVFDFFGTNTASITQSTDVIGFSFNAPNFYGTTGAAPYGGLSIDHAQSNVYYMTYIKTYGNWTVNKVPKSQLDAGNITAAAGVANGWSTTGSGTPAPSGFPSIGARNNALYIAKIATNGYLYIEKFSSWANLGIGSSYYQAFAGFGTNASVVSVNVGQFDYGTGLTYVVVTCILGSGFVYNWVFQDNGSTFIDTGLHFQIPNNKAPIGTTWVGTNNDDSTGHFETITTDGYVFKYTGLGKSNTTYLVNAEQRWRGTGTGGTTLGIGPAGPNTGNVVYQRRSRMTITSTSPIPNVSPGPNSVSFYVSHDSGTLYRYYDPANGTSEPAIGVTSITVSDFQNANATGTVAALNTGTAGQITSASGMYITGDGDAFFPGSGWKTVGGTGVAFTAGWGNFSAGTYTPMRYKKIGNTVYLEGLVTRSSGTALNVFSLPTGYRPVSTQFIVATGGQSGAYARVDIVPSTGDVNLSGGVTNGTFISIFMQFNID